MAEPVALPRLVPGAPPPIALSKSQRKKRKTGAKSKTPGSPAEGSVTIPDAPSAVLIVSPPNETDPKEDIVPTEPVAPSEAPTHDDLNPKSSPVIELVQKRMRALNKKIVCPLRPLIPPPCGVNSATSQQSRIASYAATEHEKLNDDQRRSLKTLSSLDAVYKELEDVKKSIEVCMIISDDHQPPCTQHTLDTRSSAVPRSSIKACRNRTHRVSQNPRGCFLRPGKASRLSAPLSLTFPYRNPTLQGPPHC